MGLYPSHYLQTQQISPGVLCKEVTLHLFLNTCNVHIIVIMMYACFLNVCFHLWLANMLSKDLAINLIKNKLLRFYLDIPGVLTIVFDGL